MVASTRHRSRRTERRATSAASRRQRRRPCATRGALGQSDRRRRRCWLGVKGRSRSQRMRPGRPRRPRGSSSCRRRALREASRVLVTSSTAGSSRAVALPTVLHPERQFPPRPLQSKSSRRRRSAAGACCLQQCATTSAVSKARPHRRRCLRRHQLSRPSTPRASGQRLLWPLQRWACHERRPFSHSSQRRAAMTLAQLVASSASKP